MNTHADVRYPVSLLLNMKWQTSGQWQFPQWEIAAVLPQGPTPDPIAVSSRRIYAEDAGELILWSGLWMELYRDGLQAYYQNLTGMQPSIFVLCHEKDTAGSLVPVAVSVNHGDAEGHMESDGIVLSTPLVSPFVNWLADYILQHQALMDQQLKAQHLIKKGKRRHV